MPKIKVQMPNKGQKLNVKIKKQTVFFEFLFFWLILNFGF
jgi:hypothetical protein